MFTTVTSERIFAEAWEKGFIHQSDWQMLLADIVDDQTQMVASRLMHAIRRGRLTIID